VREDTGKNELWEGRDRLKGLVTRSISIERKRKYFSS
jgi:hypothetical protein